MTVPRPSGALAAPAPAPARHLQALLLLAALLVVTLVVPSAPPASAAPLPQARDGRATVELVGSSPTLAAPGSTVTFTVRVTNGTDTALDGASVDLGVAWRPVTSRADLATWADDGGQTTAARQVTEPVDRLAPGDSTQLRLELDVDALGLAGAPWGPREMSVALVQRDAPVDVLHTFLLYAPDGAAPQRVSVSVAAPATGPAVDPLDPEGYDLALGSDTAADGRLTRLLDAAAVTESSPGMSLAVDPALVAAAGARGGDAQAWATRLTGAPASGDDDTAAGSSAGSTATSTGTNTGTSTAASGRPAEVAVLPGFDPDLAAVAHADPSRADVAAATGGEAALGPAWQRPEDWGLTVAWPEGRADAATLAVGGEAPVDQVVVSTGLAPTGGAPASARAAVDTPTGKVPALVADAGLSSALASLTDDADAPTAAEASARVLADTALLAIQQQEAGQRGLHVLAALPRGWSPDPELVGTVLGSLHAASWADVVPLSETVSSPASRVPRDGPARSGEADGELDPASVRRLLDSRRDLAAFSTVASDPVELSGDADQALVAPLAVAARTDPRARDRAVDIAVERSRTLQEGIAVADRSNVTLVSDTGRLPVTVSNELPVDATVTVVLRPNASRLVVEARPTVTVPAGTSTNVYVPVRAIGSGDVDVQVEVLAPSSAVVAGPTSFSLRVRAGWETAGTAVVAALVALLFLGGIWRTVRRGRSSARTTDEGVPDAAADPQGPADTGPPDAATVAEHDGDDETARPTPARATETDPT